MGVLAQRLRTRSTHPRRCTGLTKWQPRPEDVRWLLAQFWVRPPRPPCLCATLLFTRLLPPARYSLQVRSLQRHMERGKLTTRRKSPQQQEARTLALLSLLPRTKFKDVERGKTREEDDSGGDKINGVQHFNTTPPAIFVQNWRGENWVFFLLFGHIVVL